jgi:flagellar basal body-associated protein FliL
MATQAIEQAPAENAEGAPKGKRTVLILAIAGVLAGGAAGFLGVGPVLAKRRGPEAPAKARGSEDGEKNTAVIHAIENLVLNPAGSNGTRFLMVTATFELKDGGAEQVMKDHEAEVRDHILALLGKKNIDELTDINQREKIKKEVLDAVSPLMPKDGIRKVFFPQFVIQ